MVEEEFTKFAALVVEKPKPREDQTLALVVEKELARYCAPVRPERVPAKLLPVFVKEFTPENVLVSERSVEEAARPVVVRVVPSKVRPEPTRSEFTGLVPFPTRMPESVVEAVPPFDTASVPVMLDAVPPIERVLVETW